MTQALNASETENCAGLGGKYLTFLLQGQTYGLDILRVREIVGSRRIIPIDSATPHLIGIINLGGGIVPVVDLRATPPALPGQLPQESCTIIALTGGVQLAILSERVLDVCDVHQGECSSAVSADACVPRKFILGVANISGKPVILLDISQLLNEEDIKTACATANGKAIAT